MTEIERIDNNNNRELPNGEYDILRIINVQNPAQELADLKETAKIILQNIELDAEDKKWYKILPEKIVKFTEQLREEDYYQDDLISSIPNIIDDFQSKIRKQWEWYSSKINDNGFEIIMKGIFRGIHIPYVHHHGIPQSSIFIERNGIEYPTKALQGVLTYRKWNPDTLKLK